MAMEREWSCPICCETRDGIATVNPCCHRFCLGCIMRWAEKLSRCPLCRGKMEEIKFSMQKDDYLECWIASSKRSRLYIRRVGRAPRIPANSSPRHLVVSAASSPQRMVLQEEQTAAGTEAMGGLLPNNWAELFKQNKHFLNPVLPWLRRELGAIYGEQWWLALAAETLVLNLLCLHGLDEEAIVQQMELELGEQAELLVHGLITVIRRRCGVEAWMLLHFPADREEEEDDRHSGNSSSTSSTSSSSTSSSSSSSSTSSTSSTSSEDEKATLQGGTGRPASPSVPAEREQPQRELEEVAVAGPSLRGGSSSSSSPSLGRGSSRGGPQRPPKRRAPSPQDSPQPHKRPPRRRH
ncbi:TOPRS ligase, partial [Thinocorus orbignyianus]|nr:TOPRS ligase [Thinocorus orbignyianus]